MTEKNAPAGCPHCAAEVSRKMLAGKPYHFLNDSDDLPIDVPCTGPTRQQQRRKQDSPDSHDNVETRKADRRATEPAKPFPQQMWEQEAGRPFDNPPLRFRKKPVIVEASPWRQPGDHPRVLTPPRHCTAGSDMRCEHCGNASGKHGEIVTLESGDGYQIVCPGDWIITGIKGEVYPCKPDVFERTYERVD